MHYSSILATFTVVARMQRSEIRGFEQPRITSGLQKQKMNRQGAQRIPRKKFVRKKRKGLKADSRPLKALNLRVLRHLCGQVFLIIMCFYSRLFAFICGLFGFYLVAESLYSLCALWPNVFNKKAFLFASLAFFADRCF